MKNISINSGLKNLQVLVGAWAMELSNASFLPDPKTTIRGSISFEWFEGGNFLIMRQGLKGSGAPWSMWLVGRDTDTSDYTALYIDDRGVSRVYQMSFAKNEWRIWRNSANFSQRFVGKLSKDKKTIKARWEKSKDSKHWEHDFDIKYSRRDGLGRHSDL